MVKTAFRTNLGEWEGLFIPFRLCNVPNTSQHLINTIFEKQIKYFILFYLKNILIYSCSIRLQWNYLQRALGKQCWTKLFDQLHKSKFLKIKWATSDLRLERREIAPHLIR